MTRPSIPTVIAAMPMARVWPRAIGASAAVTARSRRSCRPSATAKSQPIAGLSPWNAPSAASVNQGQSALKWVMEHHLAPIDPIGHAVWIDELIEPDRRAHELCVAVRVGRGVSALQAHLMRPLVAEIEEEGGIEAHAAGGISIELDHPHLDAIRVELRVPWQIER